MSTKDCIDAAVAQGQISRELGDRLKKQFDNIMRVAHSSPEAKAQFEAELLAEAEAKRRRAVLMETKRKYRDAEMDGYRDWRGEEDPAKALQNMISQMSHKGTWQGSENLPADAYVGQSAEELARAVFNKAMGKAALLTHEFRKGVITGDLRRRFSSELRTRSKDIVRHLYGEKVDDPLAKALGDIATEVYGDMHRLHTAEGGEIGKLEHYAGPQAWNATALLRAGPDEFVKVLMPRLDRERMVNSATGRKLSDAELEEGIRAAYKSIVTDGRDLDEVSSAPTGKGAIWKQHADHRFFHFKSADDWLYAAEQFGNPDWYQSFVHYVGSMSRDIGAMMKFGPNPEVMLNYQKNRIRAKAANIKPMLRQIEDQTRQLNELYAALNRPGDDYQKLLAEHAAILRDIERLRSSPDGRHYYRMRLHAFQLDGTAPRAAGEVSEWERMLRADPRLRQVDGGLNQMMKELVEKQEQLNPHTRIAEGMLEIGDGTVKVDPGIASEIQALLDDMRDATAWSSRHVNDAPTYAANEIRKAETLWMHVRGQLTAPHDARLILAWDDFRRHPDSTSTMALAKAAVTAPFTGAGMATQRTLTSAVVLGNAMFSSLLSDPVAMGTRRAFIGMDWSRSQTFRVIGQMIAALADDAEARQWANASMVAADDANLTMTQQAKWAGAIDGKGASSFLLDRVLHISGLTPITLAMKRAQSRELMAFMARESAKTWRELAPNTRDWLAQAGFDAKAWDELRAIPVVDFRGAHFLRPNEVLEKNEALGMRYLAMLTRELAHGVLEGHTTVRAATLGQTRPGTLLGEGARTIMHIKTFPVTFTMIHLGQMMRDFQTPGQRARGARYAAQLIITGTAMALVTIALKDMAAGRDPRRWFDENGNPDPRVIGAAFLQSGGAGIYGDFLSAEVNRFGGGIEATLAGPLLDRYNQILRMTAGNVWETAQGKPTKFGREMTQFIRQNVPMVWQTRLMFDRVLMDEAQKWADPEAYQSFARQKQTRYRDYGKQQFWWAPGEARPQRPPNIGAVSGRN